MIKLKFINSNELDRNLKASIHKTGKIGFTVEAANKLALADNKSVSIAMNEASKTDQNLYVIVNKEEITGSYKISKAGDYYYVNAKLLFDTLKWDYVDNTISFDISLEDIEGQSVFVFKRSEKKKKPDNEQ